MFLVLFKLERFTDKSSLLKVTTLKSGKVAVNAEKLLKDFTIKNEILILEINSSELSKLSLASQIIPKFCRAIYLKSVILY